MMYRSIFFFVILCLLCLTDTCRAQSLASLLKRTSVEIDWDFRTRIAGDGPSRSGLYTGSVRIRTELEAGWSLELYGDRKDSGFFTLSGSRDFLVQQATVEKETGSQRFQAGIVRLPFGIYDYRETYASGLIDYPMPRVDFGTSAVDFGVPGVRWTGGSPRLQVEGAVFDGRASTVWGTHQNVGGVALRVQTYTHDLILGASRWDGYLERGVSKSIGGNTVRVMTHTPTQLNGLDVRYTRPHLLLRGEYLFGVLGGRQMHGWYLDVYYHLPKYEKFTLVGRLEGLRPGSGMAYGKQVTVGIRYTASPEWVFTVNWRRNNMSDAYPFSWTPYAGKGGDFFVQAYRKVKF